MEPKSVNWHAVQCQRTWGPLEVWSDTSQKAESQPCPGDVNPPEPFAHHTGRKAQLMRACRFRPLLPWLSDSVLTPRFIADAPQASLEARSQLVDFDEEICAPGNLEQLRKLGKDRETRKICGSLVACALSMCEKADGQGETDTGFRGFT